MEEQTQPAVDEPLEGSPLQAFAKAADGEGLWRSNRLWGLGLLREFDLAVEERRKWMVWRARSEGNSLDEIAQALGCTEVELSERYGPELQPEWRPTDQKSTDYLRTPRWFGAT